MLYTRKTLNAALLLAAVAATIAWSQPAAAQNNSTKTEQELIALLKSDAPKAEKGLACKHLSVQGSSAAVPELAKLLADDQLASWARIALEVIPGPEADEALRKATESLKDKLLVGAINSIGVRRDAKAVELLAARLPDQDAEVASAAAVALGNIGNAAAAKSLRPALASAPPKVRSAVAEGCVLCAERLLAEGNAAEAVAIYDDVRKADVPKQRKLEATRGAILARKQEGLPLLVEQLRSSDKAMFQMALGVAREISGSEVDQALAAELERASPEQAALVVLAMADRKTVVLPAVLKAAKANAKAVRIAALSALGRVGDASSVSPLLEIALEQDAEIAAAAKKALAALPGDAVNKDIVARLAQAEGKNYPVLIEVIGQRRIDAVSALLKAVNHSDAAVRNAALTALGNTVPDKELSALIAQVVTPTYADSALIAQQALKTAAVRMPDREVCAAEIAAAMQRAPAPAKPVLLETLASVGGTKALEAMATAAKSNDPQLQEVSSRLLGEWMTIDAAPVLLDLSKTAPAEKYQVRALRGYIRIARQFTMGEKERVEMCRNALAGAKQPAEQKLVLDVLTRYPSVETLKLAVEATKTPAIKQDATTAATSISQKLGKSDAVHEILSKAGLNQ